MSDLETFLELVTATEDYAARLRGIYNKAAVNSSARIPHHVGGAALAKEEDRGNYAPVNENCLCGLPVNRRDGVSKISGDPYVMSHCPKPKTQSCGYRKFYDPIPARQ